MGKRWVFVLLLLLLVVAPVFGHKRPVIEYTYLSHIWEEAYEIIPKQPVIDEEITFKLSVEHPNDVIEGNVTAQFAVYRDRTTYGWYNGDSYKNPDWIVIKDTWLKPQGENIFTESVVVDEPGSYSIFVDWYEDQQFIGQSMHTLDVETRTIGPMWIAFIFLTVIGTMIGVRTGVFD